MSNLKQSLQLQRKNILTLFLFIVFIWSLFSVKWNDDLVHSGGLATIGQVVEGLIHPNLSKEILSLAIESTWITLALRCCRDVTCDCHCLYPWYFSIRNFKRWPGNEDFFKRYFSCSTWIFTCHS